MFVLDPDGEHRELKAPHVPGQVELDFTFTSLSMKSKQPIIHAISFSLFGCELDLQEFSMQTHFFLVDFFSVNFKLGPIYLGSQVQKKVARCRYFMCYAGDVGCCLLPLKNYNNLACFKVL